MARGQDLALNRQHRLGRGDGLGRLPRGAELLGLVPEPVTLLERRLGLF